MHHIVTIYADPAVAGPTGGVLEGFFPIRCLYVLRGPMGGNFLLRSPRRHRFFYVNPMRLL